LYAQARVPGIFLVSKRECCLPKQNTITHTALVSVLVHVSKTKLRTDEFLEFEWVIIKIK